MAPMRKALLDSSIVTATTVIGDLKGPVWSRFYADHPEAHQIMLDHSGGYSVSNLEGLMITWTLYVIEGWIEDQNAAQIIIGNSVLYHFGYLKVYKAMYISFVDCMVDVIIDCLPPTARDERDNMRHLRTEIVQWIDESYVAMFGKHG